MTSADPHPVPANRETGWSSLIALSRPAEAAATWVRCYNARCALDLPRYGIEPPAGSFIEMLATDRTR
jgi:hypothetical protein